VNKLDRIISELDNYIWKEHIEELSTDLVEVPMGLLHAAWIELCKLRDVTIAVDEQIEDSKKKFGIAFDSHAGGVVAGLIETRELLTNGIDNPELT
jgi:hypothetical protein